MEKKPSLYTTIYTTTNVPTMFDPNQPLGFVENKRSQNLAEWNSDWGVSFNINNSPGCPGGAGESFYCPAEGNRKPITIKLFIIASLTHICQMLNKFSFKKSNKRPLYVCLVYLKTTSAVMYCVIFKSHLKYISKFLKTLQLRVFNITLFFYSVFFFCFKFWLCSL